MTTIREFESHVQSKVARWKSVAPTIVLQTFLLFLLFTPTHTALAQPPEVTLNAIPSSVNLPLTGQIEVQVVLNNLSANVLHHIQLSWFSNIDVQVKNRVTSADALAPQGEYVWNVQILSSQEGPLEGTIQFRADYSYLPVEGQSTMVQRVVFGSLDVKSLKLHTADQVADIKVLTSLSTLNEQQPGRIYLLITNKSDFSLLVRGVTFKAPGFIRPVIKNDLKDGVSIAPHQSYIGTVDISVVGAVQPGKQLLVFEVPFEWQEAKQTQKGNLVVTQVVEVEVFGASQILSLLGIPSLLILPGFLVLITWRLLLRWFSKQDADQYLLQPTKPEFWLVAITLSLIAAFIYPLVTHRNYLVGYELSDVVYLWSASIILTIASYVTVVSLYHRYKIWYAKRHVLSERDTPTQLLRKLGRQHLGIKRNYVPVNVEGEDLYAYLLEEFNKDKELFWVSPAIEVALRDGNAQTRQSVDELRKLIRSEKAPPLARLLDRGKGKVWDVNWGTIKAHSGPFQIKKEGLNFSNQQQEYLVQLDG